MKEPTRERALELANQTTPWTGQQLCEIDAILRAHVALRARFDALVGEVRLIHKEATRCDRYSPEIVEEIIGLCDAAIENAEKEEP